MIETENHWSVVHNSTSKRCDELNSYLNQSPPFFDRLDFVGTQSSTQSVLGINMHTVHKELCVLLTLFICFFFKSHLTYLGKLWFNACQVFDMPDSATDRLWTVACDCILHCESKREVCNFINNFNKFWPIFLRRRRLRPHLYPVVHVCLLSVCLLLSLCIWKWFWVHSTKGWEIDPWLLRDTNRNLVSESAMTWPWMTF